MPRKLGAIPRNPDPRDYPLASVLPVPTTQTKFWPATIRLNQGETGTCVANAWTHFLTSLPIDHPEKALLDPANQPSIAQYGSYYQYWDENGVPRAAEKYAVKLYDAIHDGVLEPLDPGREAGAMTDHGAVILKRRGLVSSYYRASSADQVIQCVLAKCPVVFASAWYSSMDQNLQNGFLNVDLSSYIRGYHAYMIRGADLRGPVPYVEMLNSWGKTWGANGTAKISVEDLHSLYIQNAWIATEVRPTGG